MVDEADLRSIHLVMVTNANARSMIKPVLRGDNPIRELKEESIRLLALMIMSHHIIQKKKPPSPGPFAP